MASPCLAEQHGLDYAKCRAEVLGQISDLWRRCSSRSRLDLLKVGGGQLSSDLDVGNETLADVGEVLHVLDGANPSSGEVGEGGSRGASQVDDQEV